MTKLARPGPGLSARDSGQRRGGGRAGTGGRRLVARQTSTAPRNPRGGLVPEQGQAGSPLPLQVTLGFQSLNMPLGFGRQIQTWSS